MNSMYGHFLNLSTSYNELRTTDQEPVLYIGEKLDSKNHIRGADIACGAGRYDLLLLFTSEKPIFLDLRILFIILLCEGFLRIHLTSI